jgi:hypothetical protein
MGLTSGLGGGTSVGGDLNVQYNTMLTASCGIYPLLDASGLVGIGILTGLFSSADK